MARKRMWDPMAWVDSAFHRLTCPQQVLFFAHISLADDEGRGVACVDNFKMACFPNKPEHDEDAVDAMMTRLGLPKRRRSNIPMVQYYSVGGVLFYFLPMWFKHQQISHPTASKLPAPPAIDGHVFKKFQKRKPEKGMSSIGDVLEGMTE